MTAQLAGADRPVRGVLWVLTILGRLLVSVLVPLAAFVVLWQGFLFLRESNAPKLLIGVVAVAWGVGGVALIYWVGNWVIGRMPERVGGRLLPYLFIGPAVAMLVWFLALPTVRTLYISLFNSDSTTFVGIGNYLKIFLEPGDARGVPEQPPLARGRDDARGRVRPGHRRAG